MLCAPESIPVIRMIARIFQIAFVQPSTMKLSVVATQTSRLLHLTGVFTSPRRMFSFQLLPMWSVSQMSLAQRLIVVHCSPALLKICRVSQPHFVSATLVIMTPMMTTIKSWPWTPALWFVSTLMSAPTMPTMSVLPAKTA